MKLYTIEDEHKNDKYIFARGFDHAAQIYVTWQMANDAPMGNFAVGRVTLASQSTIGAAHLRQALALGIDGIGKYDNVLGWTIRPIEDERCCAAEL